MTKWDAVGLILPIAFDGGAITPWGVWSTQGKDSGTVTTKKKNGLWLGAAIEVTAMDPISFGLDVMHGKVSTTPNTSDAGGWFASADVSYKMDMLTASLVAFTSTGEDNSAADGSEVMPVISNGNGAFAPTTFGTDGDWNMGAGNILTAGPGAQGVGLKLTNLSFLENLTHVVNVFYFRGTSDKDAARLAGGRMDQHLHLHQQRQCLGSQLRVRICHL